MLHILRHSPHTETRFSSCLRAISANQSLLLIEDAAYALLPGTSSRNALEYLPGNVKLYTLESDLLARGIALDDVSVRIQLIDYPMMVALCTEHSKIVSW